jgi:methylmalonyl-CoA mutase cobalamin-binding domain/chain
MGDSTQPAAADLGRNPGTESTNAEVRLAAGWDPRCMSNLVQTIEREIIPRLVLAHRPAAGFAPTLAEALGRTPSADEIAELTRLVLEHDGDFVSAHIERVRARGVSLEAIFLHLLAPTARRLGEMWTNDECDFTQVTLGLWRLQCVLHDLSPAFENTAQGNSGDQRILLAPMPGEQHSFGLEMVAEFFRRAEWDVLDGPTPTSEELIRLARREWFAVIGISLCAERHLDALRMLIRDIRNASRNKAVGIMVGGVIFNEHPDLATRVGADATALDGPGAVILAQNLLSIQLKRDVN